MNGIMQEERTLQSSASRQLDAGPSWLMPIRTPNEHFTGQIFLDTDSLESEFAAEREHEHWGLNE